MTKRRWTMAISLAVALLAGVWGVQRSSAQAPAGFKRTELQKHDLSTAGREAVTARGDFQPGATVPKHTHPGEEISYVLEGEVILEIEGKPPQTVKAGTAFFVPAGTVHSAKNAGKTAAAVLSTYIVEKGKPLATPVK
jgi:quercetin dioxygenase-like cupin family protein